MDDLSLYDIQNIIDGKEIDFEGLSLYSVHMILIGLNHANLLARSEMKIRNRKIVSAKRAYQNMLNAIEEE